MLPGSWRKSASREGARRTGERPDRGIRGRRTCTHDSRKGFRLKRTPKPASVAAGGRNREHGRLRPRTPPAGAHPGGASWGRTRQVDRASLPQRDVPQGAENRAHARTRAHTHGHTYTRVHTHAHAHAHMHTHAIKETGREAATGHACLFLGCDAPRPVSSPTVASRLTGRCRGHHRTVFFAWTQAASRLRQNPAVEQRNDSGTRTSKYLMSLFLAQCI